MFFAQPSVIIAHIQVCEVLGLRDPADMADGTSYSCENGGVLAQSNLSQCLEAFKNIGYTVTWLVCDPKDHKLPVSRPRIHFQGLDAFKLGKAAKSHVQALKSSWSRLAADVMTPRSLDCYLLSDEQVKCSQVYENLLSQNQGAKASQSVQRDLKYKKIHAAVREQHKAMRCCCALAFCSPSLGNDGVKEFLVFILVLILSIILCTSTTLQLVVLA